MMPRVSSSEEQVLFLVSLRQWESSAIWASGSKPAAVGHRERSTGTEASCKFAKWRCRTSREPRATRGENRKWAVQVEEES